MKKVRSGQFSTPSINKLNRREFVVAGGTLSAMTLLGFSKPVFSQTLKDFRVSEAIHLGMYVSIYAAKHEGFFAKHGLNVMVSSAGGIAVAVPVVLSGRAEVAVTGAGMSVNAVQEGAKVVNVCKVVGGVAMWAVGKPSNKIKSLNEFKNKTIATLRFPSSTIQTPTFAMKGRGGFDPAQNGVRFLELPPGAQIQAVLDGRADFATMFEWDVSIAREKFGLEAVYAFADVIGPLSWTTGIVTRDFVQKDPEAIQGFCNAMAEAQAALHTDRNVFIRASIAEFPQVSESVIRAAAANFFDGSTAIPRNPTISKKEWDTDMEFELSGGAIRQPRPYDEMVDNSYAERATAKYGLKA